MKFVPIDFRNVKGTEDPRFNLAAWIFRLKNEFKFPNHAVELKKCIDNIETDYKDNMELLYKPMQLLINLRNLPARDTKKLVRIDKTIRLDPFIGFMVHEKKGHLKHWRIFFSPVTVST